MVLTKPYKRTRQGNPVRLKTGEGRVAFKKRFVPDGGVSTSFSRRTGRSKRAMGYR